MRGFISAPNTSGTKLKPDSRTTNIDCSWLNIGKPCSPGMLLGMAYSIPKTEGFATIVTLDCQFETSLCETLVLMNNNGI